MEEFREMVESQLNDINVPQYFIGFAGCALSVILMITFKKEDEETGAKFEMPLWQMILFAILIPVNLAFIALRTTYLICCIIPGLLLIRLPTYNFSLLWIFGLCSLMNSLTI